LLAARDLRAQNKSELYADATMSSCELIDEGTTLRSIHMFLTGSAKATSARFRAPKPECWSGATWIGDAIESGFPHLGSSQTELFVVYAMCLQPPIYMGRINYLATGGSAPCCEYVVLPVVEFEYADCHLLLFPLTAGQEVVINANDDCRCHNPLAVESTTWGAVKSLYR
jgi:hypothetical protein